MKNIFRLLALAATLLLTACVTLQPLPREVVAGAKRIGVVSQTGDVLNKQYIGVTVFGNEQDPQNVAEWNLDFAYEQQLASATRSVFGAEAVLLSDSRSEFAEVNSLNGPYSAPAFWGPNFDKISDVARRKCQVHALDGIVIAAKWKSDDIIGSTNQYVESVGVYSRRGSAMVYVLSKIGYFDCKSGKVLVVARVLNGAAPGSDSFRARLVTTPMDPELAAKPYSQWTSGEKQMLAKTAGALPAAAWASTLREMLPAP